MSNQRSSSNFANYTFDFGLPTRSSSSAANRPLKDLHNRPNSSTNSSRTPPPTSGVGGGPLPSWTPNKPSWTHQPAPSSTRSVTSTNSSMVGDIFGKSWSSTTTTPTTTTSSSASIGVNRSDPNLFGDLLGTALGQGKSSSNVPLKSAPLRNTFSTGSLADSLPKPSSTRGFAENLGREGIKAGGGTSMKNNASRAGTRTGKDDPFGNLADFSAKSPSGIAKSGSNGNNSGVSGDFNFGASQSSSGKGTPMNSSSSGGGIGDFSFGDFQNSGNSKASAASGGGTGGDFSFGKFGGTDAPRPPPPPQASQMSSNGVDPLGDLFSNSAGGGSQSFGEVDDWGMGGEIGGGDGGGGVTTELDGLPPPPSGVTASIAVNKGLENHKQGQFADAIKWLSWAFVLMEKSGDMEKMTEVLTCRASCYKEVGEYKKAVADCSKVLDNDGNNVAVLVQRALLYESTEKYKLGAEDLRAVLRIDPTNRIAKTTIHRLIQMSG